MIALSAALIAPYFINWTNYRADFEREMTRILGRDVAVNGMARARLLPFPSVTFTDIIVAGDTADKPSMTIDEFSMDVELAPFLRGELFIFDMRLVRPVIQAQINNSGQIDLAIRPKTHFENSQISLENVTVTEGSVSIYQALAERTIILSDIAASLSAKSLAGPWRGQGHLVASDVPVTFTGSTGPLNEDGSIRVRLSISPDQLPLNMDLDGQVTLIEGEGHYAGSLDLRTFTGDAGSVSETELSRSYNRIIGNFDLTQSRLALEDFRFSTGPVEDPYTASGTATLNFGSTPYFSIMAEGAQVRWDTHRDSSENKSVISISDRLSTFTAFLGALPKPAIPGKIAINLPALVVGDTTIRDIGFHAEPIENGWLLNSVTATLPGRTRFESNGVLAVGNELAFDGAMTLAVAQPSGLAAWIGDDVDDRVRRLSAAGFSANVSLSSERQNFQNLEIIIGKSRFVGSIDRQSLSSRRPAISANIHGSDLAWTSLNGLLSLFVADDGTSRLKDHDIAMDLTARNVALYGLTAGQVDLGFRLRDDILDIDKLMVRNVSDATISATGHFENIFSQPIGDFDATIISADLAMFTSNLASEFPDNKYLHHFNINQAAYPGLLADAKLDIIASIGEKPDKPGASWNISGKTSGTDFSLSASSDTSSLEFLNAPVKVDLQARSTDAAELYSLLGLRAFPLGITGEVNVKSELTGILAEGAAAYVEVSGGASKTTFNGILALPDDGFAVQGELEADLEDSEPWLATAGIMLPGYGLGLPLNLKTRVDYDGKIAVLSALSGQIDRLDIDGDLNVIFKDNKPTVTGALNLGAMDLQYPLELIVGEDALGFSEAGWSKASLGLNIELPFDLSLDLNTPTLQFGQHFLARNAAFDFRLGGSSLSMSNLTATLYGGSLHASAEFKNNNGVGLLSSQFSLKNAEIPEIYQDTNLFGTVDLNALLTGSGKSISALVSSLSGSGTVLLTDPVINGFDASALPKLIEKADQLGIEINPEDVREFAPELITAGSFVPQSIELAFVMADGITRFPKLQLASDQAIMSAEGSANLINETASIIGTFTYLKDKNDAQGADAAVRFTLSGPWNGLSRSFDTQPLEQFLTQRALEREQIRVEHMQSILLENQRLRREARLYQSQADLREAELEKEKSLSLEQLKQDAEQKRLEQEAQRIFQKQQVQRSEQKSSPLPAPSVPLIYDRQQVLQDPAGVLNIEVNPHYGGLSEQETRRRLQDIWTSRDKLR